MPGPNHAAMTLADLRDVIANHPKLSLEQRVRMRSSIKQFALTCSKTPGEIIADPAIIRSLAKSASWQTAGLKKSTWANIRSSLTGAMAAAGIKVHRRRRNLAASPEWESWMAGLVRRDREELHRFAGWCSTFGVEPHDVTPEIFQRFYDYLHEQMIQTNPRERWRVHWRAWNRIVKARADDRYALIPDISPPRWESRQWSEFPASLRDEIDAYRAAAIQDPLMGDDPFDTSGKRPALKPVTVENYLRRLRILATLLIEDGVPIEHFSSLMVFTDTKLITHGLRLMMTSTTYYGQHYFNRTDSRAGKPRPPSEWIPLAVPPLIDEGQFNAVQALLKSRSPKKVPARFVNGPTFLAGIARCGYCGAAMIRNSGKGGAYLYYSCSRRMKEGHLSCRGVRIPMNRLDETVTHQVAERVLDPGRLRDMLEDYVRTSAQRDGDARERLSRLRQQHKEAEASIARLLQLVEQGVMEAEDAALRERLVTLRFQRDELAREITDMNRRLASAEPVLTDEKVQRAAVLLRGQLHDGPVELRQDYARMLIGEVTVTDEEIRISGPKGALARFAGEPEGFTPPRVLSSVREWRARKDSNL